MGLHETYSSLGCFGVSRALRRLPRLFPYSLLPIQELTIPHIVGCPHDVVVRALPGSGKTHTYFIGLAERFYALGSDTVAPFAMIILPTKESCVQVLKRFNRLCSPDIKADLIERAVPLPERSPNVVVATPDRAQALLQHAFLHESLRVIVLDEVDTLLSLGFESHLKSLISGIPKSCQCLVFSANPSADVKNLKNFVLHNPYVLTFTTDDRLVAELSPYNLKHFYIPCNEDDKFSWLLHYLRHTPVYSKVLVFTNSDGRSLELKNFIEKSKSKRVVYTCSVLLDGWIDEPPVLKDFNTVDSGLLIATDYTPPAAANQTMGVKEKAKKHSEQESGLECAVFKNVDMVVHVDMPADARGYERRILCTTRRASHIGESVSLACPSDKHVYEEIKTSLQSDDTLNANVLVPVPTLGFMDWGVEYPWSYELVMESIFG